MRKKGAKMLDLETEIERFFELYRFSSYQNNSKNLD